MSTIILQLQPGFGHGGTAGPVNLPRSWYRFKPHGKQYAAWRSKSRFVVLCCGRFSGKTAMARRRIVSYLPVKKPWPDPRYFYALPTYGQAKKVAWDQILSLVPKHWLKRTPSDSSMIIETIFGSKLYVLGLDKPARIEGPEWDGCVIDESSDQRPGTFDRSVRPALATRQGWCFVPGTLVQMADGSQRPIEGIRCEDLIVRADTSIGVVKQVYSRQYSGDTIRINLFGHKHLVCTPNHKFPTQRGDVAAEDLTEDDWLSIPRYAPCTSGRGCKVLQTEAHVSAKVTAKVRSGIGQSNDSSLPDLIQLSHNLGRIFGLYLAEGHCGENRITWSFNSNEEDTLVAELIKSLKQELGVEAKTWRDLRNCFYVRVYGRRWTELFKSLCGTGSATKRIHADLLSGPIEFLVGLLSGWADGDGCVKQDKGKSTQHVCSVSKSLATSMYSLANWLGFAPAIRREVSYIETKKVAWKLNWSLGSCQRIGCKVIGINTFRRVRGIERLQYSGLVHNFGVQGEHSYIADGIATKNCWRIGVPKRYGPGANEFKHAFELGQRLEAGYESYTWPSDEVAPQSEIDSLREQLDEKDFNEQIKGNWVEAGGLAYHSFGEHSKRACAYDPHRSIIVGSDFNVNPMAWVLAQMVDLPDGTKGIQVFDEIWLRNTTTVETLNVLWQRYGETHKGGWVFVGDASSRNRHTAASKSDYRQILNDSRFDAKVRYDKSNPAVKDRLAAVNAMLKNAAGRTRLWVDTRCTHLLADLLNRSMDEIGNPAPAEGGDEVKKDSGHATDALGYLVYKYFPIIVADLHDGHGLVVIHGD